MAYSKFELDEKIKELETVLENPEQSVQFADRLTTYKSFDEIRKALEYFKGQRRQLVEGRPKQTRAYATKGFC